MNNPGFVLIFKWGWGSGGHRGVIRVMDRLSANMSRGDHDLRLRSQTGSNERWQQRGSGWVRVGDERLWFYRPATHHKTWGDDLKAHKRLKTSHSLHHLKTRQADNTRGTFWANSSRKSRWFFSLAGYESVNIRHKVCAERNLLPVGGSSTWSMNDNTMFFLCPAPPPAAAPSPLDSLHSPLYLVGFLLSDQSSRSWPVSTIHTVITHEKSGTQNELPAIYTSGCILHLGNHNYPPFIRNHL